MTEESPVELPLWFNAAVSGLREEIRALKTELKRYVEQKTPEQFFQTVIFVENTAQKINNITITNSQIANLAIDSQQTIGRIDQRLGSLQDDPKGKDVANALAQITKAVAESTHLPSEQDRQDVLDGIESLLTQAAQPPAERKRGLFKPIIDSIANICGAAGGLATVWEVAGPTVRAFFGL